MKKLSLIALLISGCGVSTQHVENNPPKLHPELIQLSVEFGTFEVLNASAFLWPKDLTEDQAQSLVRTVNAASEAADPFFIEATMLGVRTKLLQAEWEKIACIDNFAVLEPGQDPMDVDHVNSWKAEDGMDDETKQLLKTCISNQTERDQIVPKLAAAQQGAAPYIDQINRAIDPDQQNPVNTKVIKVRNLKISPDAKPEIALGGFTVGGYNPSTENGKILNAQYDAKLNVLSFDVPEVNEAKEPTGLMYHFAVERGNDHGPLARFTGDMNLMDGTKIVRYGSARIDAFPPQQ